MKRLITTIMMVMFMAFLVLPLSVNADCEDYMSDLINQCFITVADNTEFTLCFGDTVIGPCPCGTATLSYMNIQIIDDIEYEALFEFDFNYDTNRNVIIIEDALGFVLVDGRLILLPEDPLIFDVME